MHKRAASEMPTDDFRLFKKKQADNKENINTNQVNKSIEDKLVQIEKQIVSNDSYNDQFLLSSMDHSISNQKKNSQLNSISFHLISENQQQAILSQQDFQIQDEQQHIIEQNALNKHQQTPQNPINRYRSQSNYKEPSVGGQGQTAKYSSNKWQSNLSQNSDNVYALNLLLNEFERRFQYVDDRIDKGERITRQINQDSKYTQELVLQIQEKVNQISKRMTKLEYKMKVIEDLFIQHKNLTDKRIIDFNAHVDQSLKMFINSSYKIQTKLDQLNDEPSKKEESKIQQQQVSVEMENIKLRLNLLSENLTKTHETLNLQIKDFNFLQKSIENISKIDIGGTIGQLANDIDTLKIRQSEVVQYLHILQESIINPSVNY